MFEQIILSGFLPVMGSGDQGYRNCQRMAINTLVQQLCREGGSREVGRADMLKKIFLVANII